MPEPETTVENFVIREMVKGKTVERTVSKGEFDAYVAELKSRGVQVTETTIAVTATLDVRVLRLLNEVDNAYGAYGRLELRINKHLNNAEVTAT